MGKLPPTVFRHLDKSTKFPEQLLDVINHRGFASHSSPIDEAMEIADYLDQVPSLYQLRCHPLNLPQALDELDHTSAAFVQVLLNLERICMSRTYIPSSHIIPARLLNVDESHTTSGGFSDTFQGTFCGLDVCVRRLRDASTDLPRKVEKERTPLLIVQYFLTASTDAVPGGLDTEMPNTRQPRPVHRRNPLPSPDCVGVDAGRGSDHLCQVKSTGEQDRPRESFFDTPPPRIWPELSNSWLMSQRGLIIFTSAAWFTVALKEWVAHRCRTPVPYQCV